MTIHETGTPCGEFVWIGQPFTSCDVCGAPAWDHDGFLRNDGRRRWPSSVIAGWLEAHLIDRQCAAHLLMVGEPS